MKKSLLAILLILAMVLSLAGCELPMAKEETAYELVSAAMKKTDALDSAHMTLEMDMSMNIAGISMNVPMDYDIKATGLTGDSPKMNMTMKMEIMGMSMDMDFYIEDNYYYMTYMGQSMKFKAEGAGQYDAMGQVDSMLLELDEKYFENVPVTRNSDGTKTVKLTLDSTAFQSIYADLIESAGSNASDGAAIESVYVSNCNVEITVDRKGYIKTYLIAFEMNMSTGVSGATTATTVGVEAAVNFVNPGSTVTVTPPDGYKNFQEVNRGND